MNGRPWFFNCGPELYRLGTGLGWNMNLVSLEMQMRSKSVAILTVTLVWVSAYGNLQEKY